MSQRWRDDAVVQHDTVTTEDVARPCQNLAGASDVVHLGQRHHRHARLARVHELAEAYRHARLLVMSASMVASFSWTNW